MDLLNNALQIGPIPSTGLRLGGRTLIFNTPTETITFPGGADATVTLPQILAALRDVAGLHLGRRQSQNAPGGEAGVWFYLALWRDGGFEIDEAGTANALLKLSTAAATICKSPLSLSAVKSVARDVSTGEYHCVVGGVDADFENPNPDGSSSTPGNSNNVTVP